MILEVLLALPKCWKESAASTTQVINPGMSHTRETLDLDQTEHMISVFECFVCFQMN
jgi:hypothetical protein